MATVANGRLTVGKTYLFKNKADGSRALNVWCSSSYPATNLSNVCLWTADTTDDAQLWKIVDHNGHYVHQSVENPAKYIDLFTGTGDGANRNAQLYSVSSTSYLTFEPGAYSNTVRIRLAGSTNNGHYLTANQGSNGTRTGKTTGAAGNVYFWGTLLTDNSQEWIFQEVDGGSSGGGTTTAEYVWPTESTFISQSFSSSHDGIDISPLVSKTPGDEVYAYMDGCVSYVGNPTDNPNEGYTVRIHHNNPLKNSNGYARIRTQYMHLNSAPLVAKFEEVQAGQLIGYMGNTGNVGSSTGSTDPGAGTHLHFEVRGGSESQFPIGGVSSNGYDTGTVINPRPYLDLT